MDFFVLYKMASGVSEGILRIEHESGGGLVSRDAREKEIQNGGSNMAVEFNKN